MFPELRQTGHEGGTQMRSYVLLGVLACLISSNPAKAADPVFNKEAFVETVKKLVQLRCGSRDVPVTKTSLVQLMGTTYLAEQKTEVVYFVLHPLDEKNTSIAFPCRFRSDCRFLDGGKWAC